jgi:type IV secretion system protein VirD4
MQRFVFAALAASAIAMSALWGATQLIARIFACQPALGRPLFGTTCPEVTYTPWSILIWSGRWADQFPRPFALAHLVVAGGLVAALLVAALALRPRKKLTPFGEDAWAKFDDVGAAGLFAPQGAIIGKFAGELLAFDGPEHQLLIGASRSGKGRGHVVPTLLAWPHSALVLDVKGELAHGDARHHFPGTAGFRETLGPVLCYAPTHLQSASFNPCFEVRKGPNEVRDVQNIIEILVDPAGDGRNQDFWDRSAKNILVGVVLHVLYAEPPGRKTLAVVREKLRNLDATAQLMKSTLHRLNPVTRQPEVHPEVLHAAESFLASEERLQSSVKATAESFFGLFADEIIAQKTANSDFRIGDLMCGERPVTLYLQPPPSDALRLMPLLRLVINQFARALMEDQSKDAQGRPKRHPLILILDEFPMLGRMPFFETMMGAMAGYGLKAFLVTQSLNHLTKAYGRDNVILDNCHVVTSFAAADGDTAKRIADMAGEVWELRESETLKRPRPILGWREGSTTIREERRPLLLPADVRALARDEQLIFVSGAKPIRAKKLKFDQERIFIERLRPASGAHSKLTTTHDWENVRLLGLIAPQPKPRSKPAMSKPLVDQPDLFAQAAARSAKISEQAMAGFRASDGLRLPHPSARPAASPTPVSPPPAADTTVADAPRRRRAKGI